MSTHIRQIACLGGTFDPIHNGHLRTALELKQTLGFDEVRLIPCIPSHREDPRVSDDQRLEMVKLAVENETGLSVDDWEIQTGEPSYTSRTLKHLRETLGPEVGITWVMGQDAWLQLPTWKGGWKELVELGNILVVERPGDHGVEHCELGYWAERHEVATLAELQSRPFGAIHHVTLNILSISSTEIRRQLSENLSPRYIMPDNIIEFIQSNGLYR